MIVVVVQRPAVAARVTAAPAAAQEILRIRGVEQPAALELAQVAIDSRVIAPHVDTRNFEEGRVAATTLRHHQRIRNVVRHHRCPPSTAQTGWRAAFRRLSVS